MTIEQITKLYAPVMRHVAEAIQELDKATGGRGATPTEVIGGVEIGLHTLHHCNNDGSQEDGRLMAHSLAVIAAQAIRGLRAMHQLNNKPTMQNKGN